MSGVGGTLGEALSYLYFLVLYLHRIVLYYITSNCRVLAVHPLIQQFCITHLLPAGCWVLGAGYSAVVGMKIPGLCERHRQGTNENMYGAITGDCVQSGVMCGCDERQDVPQTV